MPASHSGPKRIRKFPIVSWPGIMSWERRWSRPMGSESEGQDELEVGRVGMMMLARPQSSMAGRDCGAV